MSRTSCPVRALHLLHAFATDVGLCIGQVAVDGTSNEITALPELLGLLDLSVIEDHPKRGRDVTMDALYTQRAGAKLLHEAGAYYAMANSRRCATTCGPSSATSSSLSWNTGTPASGTGEWKPVWRAGTPKRLLALLRGHWAVENNLHWVLDVTMGEDASLVRRGHGPRNRATLKRVALNAVRIVTGKNSTRHAMRDAVLDVRVLADILDHMPVT